MKKYEGKQHSEVVEDSFCQGYYHLISSDESPEGFRGNIEVYQCNYCGKFYYTAVKERFFAIFYRALVGAWKYWRKKS